MNSTPELTFSSDCMRLSGVLDFSTVVTLEAPGARWLRERAPANCRLDMRDVSRSNSAGTALLLSWLRTAAAAGKTMRIEHPPESLCALLQLGGLEKVLGADGLPDAAGT